MDYIELRIDVANLDEGIVEQLIAELSDVGYESFMEAEDSLYAYIPVENYQESVVKVLLYNFKNHQIRHEPVFVAEQNWNAVWEENFDPVIVNDILTIRAPFHKNLPKTKMEIVMEPKMAFGTGHHETTYLMAEALLSFPVKNLQVLDMGCGTGVLAILAAKCGAKKYVDAVDIDIWAKDSTLENASRNGVSSKVRVLLGDASLIQREKYELILANINRNILLDDMCTYASGLKREGTLMVSGIYTTDMPTITAKASCYDLKEISSKSKNDWAMIVFEKY